MAWKPYQMAMTIVDSEDMCEPIFSYMDSFNAFLKHPQLTHRYVEDNQALRIWSNDLWWASFPFFPLPWPWGSGEEWHLPLCCRMSMEKLGRAISLPWPQWAPLSGLKRGSWLALCSWLQRQAFCSLSTHTLRRGSKGKRLSLAAACADLYWGEKAAGRKEAVSESKEMKLDQLVVPGLAILSLEGNQGERGVQSMAPSKAIKLRYW